MKKKHWQGYGTVNIAVNYRGLMKNDQGKMCKGIYFTVQGNHEYGVNIGQKDNYRLISWLGKILKIEEKDIDYYTAQEFLTYGEDVCAYHVYLKEEKNV